MATTIDDFILDDVRKGKPLIIVDDPNREDEGDFCVVAQQISERAVTFMRTNGSGIICVPMMPERLESLGLALQVPESYGNQSICRFTVSVDYNHLEDHGVSDRDRYLTISALANPHRGREYFTRPGHLFPLRAEPNGLMARQGHTEAAVELARYAGLYPAGAICEVLTPRGTMARGQELEEFARKHNIRITSVADIKKVVYGS